MNTKRKRHFAFAALMSLSTATLVSGVILLLNGVGHAQFITRWAHSILVAWPLVFIAILTIAPPLNRWLDRLFKAD